jgi:histidyl-tRNA synthetase
MISTGAYKGTRDFYPEDFARRQYIFDKWTSVISAFGYNQIDASILENAELYKAKSGEELGTKQLYSFTDKGDREVAIRPEMTPTVARMIAARYGELRQPIRWFSIPNCFRYERPQKGRLREFWQLNVDIIGNKGFESDLEILLLSNNLFKAFNAPINSYIIKWNHRTIMDIWIQDILHADNKDAVYDLLDRWHKLTFEEREEATNSLFNEQQLTSLNQLVNKDGLGYEMYLNIIDKDDNVKNLIETLGTLEESANLILDPTIVRGIAYYTGIVFEAFDTNENNNRALFGGGRYDSLLSLFGEEAPAVGLGVGDVTWAEYLTNWNLWPEKFTTKQKTGIILNNKESISKLYTIVIPELISKDQIFDIDYDYGRNEKKRYESLKKRGCDEIITVSAHE